MGMGYWVLGIGFCRPPPNVCDSLEMEILLEHIGDCHVEVKLIRYPFVRMLRHNQVPRGTKIFLSRLLAKTQRQQQINIWNDFLFVYIIYTHLY